AVRRGQFGALLGQRPLSLADRPDDPAQRRIVDGVMSTADKSAQADSTRPLAHIRVLDLSRMYPGAYCTSLLADLGADVVKLEAPGAGDGLRFLTIDDFPATHIALNRGKRSVTLNLRSPQAGDVLRRLVAHADVLVESQRPGSLEQAGLGFD